METIPSEIFLEICSQLYVKDLYTLTLVCRSYRKVLWSKTISIQKIWTCSRVLSFDTYLPYPTLLPPKSMSEQEYIWFTMLADKCSICKTKIEKQELFVCRYWEFGRICCKECIEKKTINVPFVTIFPNTRKVQNSLPKDLLECMPYHERHVFNLGDERLYWADDLQSIQSKYYAFENEQQRDNWVKEKREEVRR
ncbi:4796_t:CDS:2 [Funneliformis caledonium]|uniref:4796_t:CDS:1 n=1 Tax=Funneliformis caledonium TaxID=1117310 RepID=A0A9N9FV90_9GLOM|nr:4796_t:CDS:2 [Funneliformis caledonium]